MTFTTLKDQLLRQRELNDWLKRQRRNRIDPLPFNDSIRRDLNIDAPVAEEPRPAPAKAKSGLPKPPRLEFAFQGGFA